MIDFNPYEVEHINFMKKDRYLAFRKMTPAQRQVDITANTTESHYIYTGAFKKPEIDPQKLYSADDLTESIFIQEVRINIELNDWLITNVFRKQNDHVLSRNFKFKYHYVNYQMAERRNLEEKTGLCNKLCVLLDKDYNILFCGLIDQESNSVDESEINFELRIFSFAYLLSKASDVEVALFDKNNVTEYNHDQILGAGVTGELMQRCNNVAALLILETYRYFFGDDPLLVDSFLEIRGRFDSGVSKTGRIVVEKELFPLIKTITGIERNLNFDRCFLTGNDIYAVYSAVKMVKLTSLQLDGTVKIDDVVYHFTETPIITNSGTSPAYNILQYGRLNYDGVSTILMGIHFDADIGSRSFPLIRYYNYKMSVDDNIKPLSEFNDITPCATICNGQDVEAVWVAALSATNSVTATTGDTRFDFWKSETGTYYTKMLPAVVNTGEDASLVIDYKLPDQADYDICSGSGDTLKGEMLKLGDLAQFVCFYEMWYLDVDNDGIIRAKSKAVLRDNIQPVQRGTDISIRPLRRLNMTRKTFDCIDILNMSKPGTDNIQKIYDSLYNLRLYDSPFEEVDSVTVEKTNPGDLVHYQGNGIFLAVECDQVYAPEGFRYSKNKMWRTSYE